MSTPNDPEAELWIDAIIACIKQLPEEEQEQAVLHLIGKISQVLPDEMLHEISAEIKEEFEGDLECVERTLNIVAGELAIREILS